MNLKRKLTEEMGMKIKHAVGIFGLMLALFGFVEGLGHLRPTVAADVQDVRIVNSKTPFLERVDLTVGKSTTGPGGAPSSGFLTQDVQQIFQVPAGKRLVIEHASAEVNQSNQIDLSIHVGGTSDGSNRKIYLSYSPQIPFARKIILSQPLRLYVNPGFPVVAIGEFNVNPEKIVRRPVFCRLVLSGYLEDAP